MPLCPRVEPKLKVHFFLPDLHFVLSDSRTAEQAWNSFFRIEGGGPGGCKGIVNLFLKSFNCLDSGFFHRKIPYTRFLLVFYFIGGDASVHVSMLLSQFIPPSPPSARLCPRGCSLCLHIYLCPGTNSFVPFFSIPHTCINI